MSKDPREQVLSFALGIVTGDRAAVYGGVEDNFQRIANLWNAYLHDLGLDLGIELDPRDVAILMVLMKVARLGNSPSHFDSWADIAGYAACGYAAGEPEA